MKRRTQGRSVSLPVVLALAVVTGAFALLAVRLIGTSSASTIAAGRTASERTAQRFYDAVNETLATGDARSLRATLAEGYLDHAERPGLEPNAEGLVRYVLSLRAVFPRLQIDLLDLFANGERVVARTRVSGGEGTFLGLPIGGADVWSPIEIARTEGGRVAEHWGNASAVLAEPMGGATLEIRDPRRRVVTVEQRTYPVASAERLAVGSGPTLLIVESGVLTVTVDAISPDAVTIGWPSADGAPFPTESVAPGDSVRIGAGQLLSAPENAALRLENDGGEPTTALAVRLLPAAPSPPAGGASTAAPADGRVAVERRVLAGTLAVALPSQTLVVAVGRIALGPGAGVVEHVAAGPELLIVESGAVGFSARAGRVWTRAGVDGVSRSVASAVLPVDDSLLAEPGATVSYRVAGDAAATALVVTIRPSAEAESARMVENGG